MRLFPKFDIRTEKGELKKPSAIPAIFATQKIKNSRNSENSYTSSSNSSFSASEIAIGILKTSLPFKCDTWEQCGQVFAELKKMVPPDNVYQPYFKLAENEAGLWDRNNTITISLVPL